MYKFFCFEIKIKIKIKADSYMPCEAMAHSTKYYLQWVMVYIGMGAVWKNLTVS